MSCIINTGAVATSQHACDVNFYEEIPFCLMYRNGWIVLIDFTDILLVDGGVLSLTCDVYAIVTHRVGVSCRRCGALQLSSRAS